MITGLYILTAQKEDSSGVLKESGSGVVEQRGLPVSMGAKPSTPAKTHPLRSLHTCGFVADIR